MARNRRDLMGVALIAGWSAWTSACTGDDGSASSTSGATASTSAAGTTTAASDGTGTESTGSTATSATSNNSNTSSSTATSGDTGDTDTGGDPPPATCDHPLDLAPVDAPDHVVGDGTPASCSAQALADAGAQGGTIVFACGDAPHTITLPQALPITEDTVLDGGGSVTLAGGGSDRLLVMDTGNFEATSPHLTVQRLTLRGGRASGTPIPLGTDVDGGGGAIFFRGGSVAAIDARFIDNKCAAEGPDVGGGAIYGIGAGELIVVGSTFTGNEGANGGAIGILGAALTVVDSLLEGNRATGFGANYVEGGMQMGRGGNGGAIVMDGQGRDLSLCGAVLRENSSGAFGGAIFRTSYESEPTTIDRTLIEANEARDRMDDLPSGAGALYLQGSTVTITASTIAQNRARSSAGVWILGHGQAPAVADLTNVTITGNATWPRDPFTDRGIGAGLTIGDNTTGTILNCTIAGNDAQFASGIARATPLTIRNTIISNLADNQYTPLNCTGSSYATPPGSGDHDLQWPTGLKDDMDCVAGITRQDPLLAPLADNGGPTPTLLPMPGSPALAAGSGCPPTDQRGQPRADPCTLGAVEVP